MWLESVGKIKISKIFSPVFESVHYHVLEMVTETGKQISMKISLQ